VRSGSAVRNRSGRADDNGAIAAPSSWTVNRAPWGKGGSPTGSRVINWNAGTRVGSPVGSGPASRRSPEKTGRGGRVPVVVRGRESRPHGEGEQVSVGLQTKEK